MQSTRKKERPIFTIITVCFNSAQTIGRTIKSVFEQTYQDYEYWIIDGGSTDGTLNIISSYDKKFEGKLFVISEPDTGIYNAMNKGIKYAHGEIIGLLNSDDWLENNALSSIAKYVINGKGVKSIFCGWVRFHYNRGKVNILRTNENRHRRCYKNIEIGVRHPATFVGRDIYKDIGLFDERFKIMADADFILRCTEYNVPFVFVNDILTNMSDGGISNHERKHIKLYCSEIKLLCKKHTKTKLLYHYYTVKKIVKLYLKILTPHSILRLYRSIR